MNKNSLYFALATRKTMRTKDEAKETLILEAALRLITQTGLSGLKMADLAKEAGVATGTVYIYFVDKPALISRLYTYLLRTSLRDLTRGVLDADPLRVKIRKMARNYLDENILHPEYNAFFEQYFRSPFYEETTTIQLEESTMLKPIYDVVQLGQAETIIKEANPDLLVTLVCGMLNELAKQTLYTKQPIADADWNTTFLVIWDGIKR